MAKVIQPYEAMHMVKRMEHMVIVMVIVMVMDMDKDIIIMSTCWAAVMTKAIQQTWLK